MFLSCILVPCLLIYTCSETGGLSTLLCGCSSSAGRHRQPSFLCLVLVSVAVKTLKQSLECRLVTQIDGLYMPYLCYYSFHAQLKLALMYLAVIQTVLTSYVGVSLVVRSRRHWYPLSLCLQKVVYIWIDACFNNSNILSINLMSWSFGWTCLDILLPGCSNNLKVYITFFCWCFYLQRLWRTMSICPGGDEYSKHALVWKGESGQHSA